MLEAVVDGLRHQHIESKIFVPKFVKPSARLRPEQNTKQGCQPRGPLSNEHKSDFKSDLPGVKNGDVGSGRSTASL